MNGEPVELTVGWLRKEEGETRPWTCQIFHRVAQLGLVYCRHSTVWTPPTYTLGSAFITDQKITMERSKYPVVKTYEFYRIDTITEKKALRTPSHFFRLLQSLQHHIHAACRLLHSACVKTKLRTRLSMKALAKCSQTGF